MGVFKQMFIDFSNEIWEIGFCVDEIYRDWDDEQNISDRSVSELRIAAQKLIRLADKIDEVKHVSGTEGINTGQDGVLGRLRNGDTITIDDDNVVVKSDIGGLLTFYTDAELRIIADLLRAAE